MAAPGYVELTGFAGNQTPPHTSRLFFTRHSASRGGELRGRSLKEHSEASKPLMW